MTAETPSSRLFAPVLPILGLATAYFLAGKLSLDLALVHPQASAVWPPTGIALAILLLQGYRLWPGVLLGAFLVNVTIGDPGPDRTLAAACSRRGADGLMGMVDGNESSDLVSWAGGYPRLASRRLPGHL